MVETVSVPRIHEVTMTTANNPNVRLLPAQATGAKAKQALMIASGELDVFTYREGYQLADLDQRAALERTLRDEFDTSIPLPTVDPDDEDAYMVSYLVVVNGLPVLVPEEEAQPFALALVLALAGVKAARRVSYRPDMLPES
jgi:hypothetical protein